MSPDKKDYGHHDYPVERFGAAINFLKSRGIRKIGIAGASTTGMLALIAASYYPDITLTIAMSPCDVIMEGFYQDGKDGMHERPGDKESTVSWQGKPLPYLPYAYRHPEYWQKIKEASKAGKDMIASRQSQNPMMGQMQMGGDGPSTLGKLFDAWGVKFDTGKISCDLAAATRLGNNQGGVDENPAFLSLGKSNMNDGDLLVSRLTQVMLPFAGSFSFAKKDMDIEFTSVMTTSKDNSCSLDKMALQFGGGMKDMVPDGSMRILAARLSGTFKTAFPKGPDGTNDVSKALSEGKGSVLIIADSDFLADDFCVRIMKTPFGQIPQLINENLTLFSNIIEQFAGREELIGVRSRGASDRPFTKVNELEAEAMRKWQQKEADLQAELQATQQRLQALQSKKSGNERMILSKEQQDEIIRFRKMQADTSRQLKNVRKELTSGIDSLGLTLKTINIALMPLLVILFGLGRGWLRRKRA
jgi:ABC-type uncharacterized transport system involved in gliding motility auxiliary subunit